MSIPSKAKAVVLSQAVEETLHECRSALRAFPPCEARTRCVKAMVQLAKAYYETKDAGAVKDALG